MTGPSRLCFCFICRYTAIYRREWRAGEETLENMKTQITANRVGEAVNEPLEPCRARGDLQQPDETRSHRKSPSRTRKLALWSENQERRPIRTNKKRDVERRDRNQSLFFMQQPLEERKPRGPHPWDNDSADRGAGRGTVRGRL